MNTPVTLALATLLAVAGALVPRPVDACSAPAPIYRVDVPDDGFLVDVPLEGVLVLRAEDPTEGYVGLPTVTVRDSEGVEVPGTTEEVVLDRWVTLNGFYGPRFGHDTLIVWRADSALAPEADYSATIAQASDFIADDRHVGFRTRADSFAGVEMPTATFDARTADMPVTLARECDPGPGTGECPTCRYTDTAWATELTVTVEADADPYVYYRIATNEADPVERSSHAWLGGDPVDDMPIGSVVFREHAGERCAWLEAVSLIDGSIVATDEICTNAGPAEPPVAEPPVAEPPVAEPPVAEPPVAEPHAGCSASSAAGTPWLALLAMAGFALGRRRR